MLRSLKLRLLLRVFSANVFHVAHTYLTKNIKGVVCKVNVKRRSILILKFNSKFRERGIRFLVWHGADPVAAQSKA